MTTQCENCVCYVLLGWVRMKGTLWETQKTIMLLRRICTRICDILQITPSQKLLSEVQGYASHFMYGAVLSSECADWKGIIKY